jgi:hypothetical protein
MAKYFEIPTSLLSVKNKNKEQKNNKKNDMPINGLLSPNNEFDIC